MQSWLASRWFPLFEGYWYHIGNTFAQTYDIILTVRFQNIILGLAELTAENYGLKPMLGNEE